MGTKNTGSEAAGARAGVRSGGHQMRRIKGGEDVTRELPATALDEAATLGAKAAAVTGGGGGATKTKASDARAGVAGTN